MATRTAYNSGFGNGFETEALPGALPVGRNSPQRCAYGLYAEQLSGSPFTAPRSDNERSWLYRIRPTVQHWGRMEKMDAGHWRTAPCVEIELPPAPMRWSPIAIPETPLSFLEGMYTITTAGDAGAMAGMAAHVYCATRSMEREAFYNADGEMLIVPQQGELRLRTEFGIIDLEPGEVAVIPRGVKFRAELIQGPSRGYVCENYGGKFTLPERGPIGANCLANPRDFLTPVAAYEESDEPSALMVKWGGSFWKTKLGHSPLDVVAWHGNYSPYKYDLRRFSPVGPLLFDHADPSIFTVLTSPSETPGTANVDFVCFPDRWTVAENTFRPPWYHMNVMSEFMGLIYGQYDAKPEGFVPGGFSLHNTMLPHGPDVDAFEKASNAELKPVKLTNTMAFMFETRFMQRVTRYAAESPAFQNDYADYGMKLKKRFNPKEILTMKLPELNRRQMLVGTGASLAGLALAGKAEAFAQAVESKDAPTPDQIRRMKWWHEAKFGMFIHFGVYSSIGRHEWVMEDEAIPISEYAPHAATFNPAKNSPRAWAKLAKAAGMKYMVMTSKHHEGFCNFDSKLTSYCATKQGPGRDIAREYVEAARAEGLRVGFYYSLMDWHHPDGAKCATDEAARKRFVDYTHGLIREILTNYGKIDVLWYDVAWPLDAKGWESERMNKMVFELQPDIIVNNRNKLAGDFSTPEQKIVAETGGRAWESCMTLNDSWGYQRADDNWKSSKTIIRNLISCVRDGGNYLLNIGPKPDGSIPEESVKALSEVGDWMKANGHTIYETDLCQVKRSNYASFTRTGNTLYMHVHFWPGEYVAISGLRTKVLSAKLVKTGAALKFTQDDFRVRIVDLPMKAPDSPITTIALVCESEPTQDTDYVRKNKPRMGV